MFVNLTPHILNIHTPAGVVNVPPSGRVVRVAQTSAPAGEAEGVALYRVSYGEVVGLPAPVPGVLLIVSGMVREALAGSRADVASPGALLRGADGQPIGCNGLNIG